MQTAPVSSTPPVFRQNPALGFLDAFAEELATRPSRACVDRLIAVLDDLRQTLQIGEWRKIAVEMTGHPIGELLLQDPNTRRAFEKPRGYAGDAVMLDHLYDGTPEPLDTLGAAVFESTTQGLSSQAVRERRIRLAEAIDDLAATMQQPHVLGIACGHSRELDLSTSFSAGGVSVTCLDQDTESLAVVASRYPSAARVKASVKDILLGRVKLPTADLVTCAGLFDYLADDVATALLARFIQAAKPGGRILVANFASDSTDRGYMEAFMNWLIYRSESELRGLVQAAGLQSVRTYRDQSGRVIYLDIVR